MGQRAMDIFRKCIPLFQTLSDPHRQDIILLLAEHDALTVNEITEHSSLSRPAISHHLKLLKEKGLIDVEQKGTLRYYSLALDESVQLLKDLIDTVEHDCL
ncbi:metalloregulator ArsR/SmtB family transcription factor [Cytobacillus spongiae]|jgi:DNA-binding transcriptional ArsR family regulator|uniref:ArsR/SmtB family transcription factor n=1 Tax=Cytobacillus spongiae TaxID=2901381 RepID=UPI001F2E3698|nr:metalloregulator ArsR/SmtB family transcription factor [Cytobacillus spongiae]UII57736.1 metalloregulator ArsR/SmtB family transcription factor [Cytobacillus spongiae]